MLAEPAIPEVFWRRILWALGQARRGEWPAGGQIRINVSPDGRVASVEWGGRDDGRQ